MPPLVLLVEVETPVVAPLEDLEVAQQSGDDVVALVDLIKGDLVEACLFPPLLLELGGGAAGVVLGGGESDCQRPRVLGLVLGDQALGLGHVLHDRVLGLLQVADLGGRERTAGDLTDAGADGIDERLLVGGVGESATHPAVQEGRAFLGDVKQGVADLGVVGDLRHREFLGVAEFGDGLTVCRVEEIDGPALEGVAPAQRIGDGAEFDLVEVGVRRVPVVGVLLHREQLVGPVVGVHERPRADRLGLQRLVVVGSSHPGRRGDHACLPSQSSKRERRPGGVEGDDRGHRVRGVEFDAGDGGEHVAGDDAGLGSFEVVDYRRPIEWCVVVEGHVGWGGDPPLRVVLVGSDRLCQVGAPAAFSVGHRQ